MVGGRHLGGLEGIAMRIAACTAQYFEGGGWWAGGVAPEGRPGKSLK